jgi:hypothetical protein
MRDSEEFLVVVILDGVDRVRNFYEWQIDNLNMETWRKKLEDETENLGVSYIWHSQSENCINCVCKTIKEKATI